MKSHLLCLAALACGCGAKDGGERAAPATDAGKVAVKTVDAAAKAPAVADAGPTAPATPDAGPAALVVLPEGQRLTEELLIALIAQLAPCEMSDWGVSITCAQFRPLSDAQGQSLTDSTLTLDERERLFAAAALASLDHASPVVRQYAVHMLFWFERPVHFARIATAIQAEPDLTARMAMIHDIGNQAKDTPLAAVLLAEADHADPKVRTHALAALAKNRGLPGGLEKLIDKMKNDPDRDVRGDACEAAGELADERLLPVYVELLRPDGDKDIYDECLNGLVAMWFEYDASSKKAYEMTLEQIAKGRRDTNPVEPLGKIASIVDDMKNKPEDWKAKKWVNLKAIRKAFTTFILDRSADNALTRDSAIDDLRRLGATDKDLKAIKKKYTPPLSEGESAFVLPRIDELLAAPVEDEE